MRISGTDANGILKEYTKINESSVANMGSGTPTAVVVPAPGSNAAGGSGVPKSRYPGLISNVSATGSQSSAYENNEEVSDHESLEMAKSQLLLAAHHALKIFEMLESGKKLEGWTASKITLAADYIQTVSDYMEYNRDSSSGKDVEVIPITVEKTHQRLDKKCWKGKHKEGTKMKGGVRVNNCVSNKK